MQKILLVIISLTLLFFSTNSFAFDCEGDPCGGLIRTSEYCKCVAEFNSECCDIETGVGCLYPWSGEPYTEFSACMKGLLPLDRLFFGPGDSCVAAVCKFYVQLIEDSTYKNLGQCMKDKALKYELSEGLGFGPPCNYEDGYDTWVQSCECTKETIYGSSE